MGVVITGVMTIDGRDIIPPQQNKNLLTVPDGDGIKAFILNDNWGWRYVNSNNKNDENQAFNYQLIIIDGNIVKTGSGVLTYVEAFGLYMLQHPDYFAWLDSEANTIISIPFMSYMLD